MIDEQSQYDLEVLGTCMTNPTESSQYSAEVEGRYLWSYAQEEALAAMSEQGGDACYRLVKCPERRAKRIAARYADLFFRSEEKSRGGLQFYWVALAAFVVKDIVEAYRYAREEILNGGWHTWSVSQVGSMVMTDASPYEHAMRTYAALAKGNLWLFMDVYPWLWFFLEYGIRPDGSVNQARLNQCVGERDWNTLQTQSKRAVEELPFGRNWMGRLQQRLDGDTVYAGGEQFFDAPLQWSGHGAGYGEFTARTQQAHTYVKREMPGPNEGYCMPIGRYWRQFDEAFFVLEEERKEWVRLHDDSAALARLEEVRSFAATEEIRQGYQKLLDQPPLTRPAAKALRQQEELAAIAKHEQLNVLQPLIYDDMMLKGTLDANHQLSRRWGSWVAPPFRVVYSARPTTDDPELQTVFDAPSGFWDRVDGTDQSLPNPNDRMRFVGEIAGDFNALMAPDSPRRAQLITDLQTIRGWLDA